MPSKRPVRRTRPKPQEMLDSDISPGRADTLDGDDVAIMLRDGEAFFAPRAIRNATPRQQHIFSRLQQAARQSQAAQVQVQMGVVDGRSEGLSWDALGWCLGITGEAVRKRYG